MRKSFLWLFITFVVIVSALVLFQRSSLTRGYVSEGFEMSTLNIIFIIACIIFAGVIIFLWFFKDKDDYTV